jgi:hypothetical protein
LFKLYTVADWERTEFSAFSVLFVDEFECSVLKGFVQRLDVDELFLELACVLVLLGFLGGNFLAETFLGTSEAFMGLARFRLHTLETRTARRSAFGNRLREVVLGKRFRGGIRASFLSDSGFAGGLEIVARILEEILALAKLLWRAGLDTLRVRE